MWGVRGWGVLAQAQKNDHKFPQQNGKEEANGSLGREHHVCSFTLLGREGGAPVADFNGVTYPNPSQQGPVRKVTDLLGLKDGKVKRRGLSGSGPRHKMALLFSD